MPIIIQLLGLLFITGSAAITTGCSDGSDGEPGYNVLIEQTEIFPGGACNELGGVKIITGQDKNRNGVLDASESTESILCERRVDGVASLIRPQSVPVGDAYCPNGGIEYLTGLDQNNNAFLDDFEVTNSLDVDGARKVCNGFNGTDGVDGFTSLARTIDIPMNEKGCLYGGKELQVGLDTSRNGVLDPAEVETTSVICSVGVNTNQTVVRRSLIAPGAQYAPGLSCEYGGVKTEIGVDLNNNYSLDPSEVDQSSTTNVCNQAIVINGVDGINSLVETYPANSSQCAYGGFVFEAGLDSDDNGILSSLEASSYELVCNGYDGLTSLVEQSSYSGSNCGVNGGIRFESGLDFDENGFLDFSEVQQESFICNGDNGFDGIDGVIAYDSLIETSPVSPNSSCGSVGGLMIETGSDEDFDGILDFSEVRTTDFVCDGFNGYTTLVETEEDFGFYCLDGGLIIDTGLDYDEDGFLDSDEIEQTSYLCR